MPGLRTSGRVESCWQGRVAESERRGQPGSQRWSGGRVAGAGWREDWTATRDGERFRWRDRMVAEEGR